MVLGNFGGGYMWFWVIRVFWDEGSGVEDGLLTVPLPSDEEDALWSSGLMVFNSQEEAQAYLDEEHPNSDYEPTPLRHTHIIQTVESDHEGTPDRILYRGGYTKGEKTGAPITSEQFKAALGKDVEDANPDA